MAPLPPPPSIFAHIHCFYPKHLKECVDTLAKYPKDGVTLVVTYPKGDAGIEAHIKTVAPDATLLPLPNVGRDVAPFIAALKWAVKQEKPFDYVVKMHTKSHDNAKDWRRGWRTSMLNPLKDWARVRKELDTPGVGMVGAQSMLWTPARGKFWGEADIPTMQAACNECGYPDAAPAPFFAGTIWAARWEAVAPWATAKLPKFEPEPMAAEKTLAHGMERAFGALLPSINLQCKGL